MLASCRQALNTGYKLSAAISCSGVIGEQVPLLGCEHGSRFTLEDRSLVTRIKSCLHDRAAEKYVACIMLVSRSVTAY